MMQWEKLLSGLRLGQEERDNNKFRSARTGFQVDYDRIVFSPAFRRLQNKTQVFPLPKSDFVRNRLTHSLETASVGRSLGNLAGELILEKYNSLRQRYDFSDFGSLVSAACLAHDIGNPPFGHAGEDAISSYFRSGKASAYLTGLNPVEQADLQNFEGNAAGFRILAHTPPSNSNIKGGLGLCYSTYASFVKYPKQSYPVLKHLGKQHLKKYNFFQAESAVYKTIAGHLQIGSADYEGTQVYHRYPLAYLVEASDDICYTIIDYEDGFQMGLIPFDEIESVFVKLIGKDQIDRDRYINLHANEVRIAYLRSKAINSLVQATARSFIENEEAILNGNFDASLPDRIPQADLIDYIKKESFKNIYTSEYILKVEAAGYKVLPGLLDFFCEAVFSDDKFHKGLRKLIPSVYLDNGRNLFNNPYDNLLNITMYIASLTDQHAIKLYREINGISLSEF